MVAGARPEGLAAAAEQAVEVDVGEERVDGAVGQRERLPLVEADAHRLGGAEGHVGDVHQVRLLALQVLQAGRAVGDARGEREPQRRRVALGLALRLALCLALVALRLARPLQERPRDARLEHVGVAAVVRGDREGAALAGRQVDGGAAAGRDQQRDVGDRGAQAAAERHVVGRAAVDGVGEHDDAGRPLGRHGGRAHQQADRALVRGHPDLAQVGSGDVAALVRVERVAVLPLPLEAELGRGRADLAGRVVLVGRLEPVEARRGLLEGVVAGDALGVVAVVGAEGVEQVVRVDVLAVAVGGQAAEAGGLARPVVGLPVDDLRGGGDGRQRGDDRGAALLLGVQDGRLDVGGGDERGRADQPGDEEQGDRAASHGCSVRRSRAAPSRLGPEARAPRL